LFINKPGVSKEEDLQSLLDEIERETKLPIEVEEVYSWMAFISSRQNPRLSVANRFFGLQQDGEFKMRGIACRREDTPLFVAKTQLQMLQILAQERDPSKLNRLLPDVVGLLQNKVTALYQQTLPREEFFVTQRLSRDLADYKVPSHVARAGMQLQSAGKQVQMGQRIQFIYSKTEQRVHAWDLPESLPIQHIDTAQYKEFLLRAAHEILQPLGVSEKLLAEWLFSKSNYLAPPGILIDGQDVPLFAGLFQWRQLCM
jgi:DNA polymerase elongation subunit (family B)